MNTTRQLISLRWNLLAVIAGGLLVAGCGSQKGKTVFTASPNGGTVVGVAPETGTYELFTSLSPNPTMTIHLDAGNKLGFQKSADGRIEAVYLDKTYDFGKETGQVYWKLEN